ncbi:MAG: S41 family peptidase [Eubacterium sp.]|nr:S41 family peptidase [Eubacterium sp.]
MKNEGFRIYIQGILTGILLAVCLLAVAKHFGIHLIPAGSLADDVWERAKVVEKYIDNYYWKEDVSDQKISEYAAKGMVSALGDKYSVYYTDEEYEAAMNSVEGVFVGIGVTVSQEPDTNRKIIQEVQKGKPGEKAGLKEGDEIQKVNGTDVTSMSLTDTVNLIQNKEGKKSVLGISRVENGKKTTFDVTVTCEEIVNQSVSSWMLSDGIGYLRISEFDNKTVGQFEEAVKKLEEKNQKGMIVDVRKNGGGSLSAAVTILDELLPKGKLITEKSRDKGDKVYESTDEKHFDKPLVVLIDQSSASASEVFAGTLQDRGAASLVGVKSFGKGIVQTIYSLKNSCGGGIKLTTGEYLLPSGRSIHEKGLTPDVESEYTGTSGKMAADDDNQLTKAIEVMKAKVQ